MTIEKLQKHLHKKILKNLELKVHIFQLFFYINAYFMKLIMIISESTGPLKITSVVLTILR